LTVSSSYHSPEYEELTVKNDRFCAIGSIQHALAISCGEGASESNEATNGLFGKVTNYLTHAMAQLGFIPSPRKTLDGQFSQVINFNDATARTKDEVLAAFNKAVSNAKRRHLNG